MSIPNLLPLVREMRASLLRRGLAVHCTVDGCTAPTREGKPWCQEHVGESPYVRRLVAEIDTLERQAERGRGPLLREEILSVLANGPRSTEKLRLLLGSKRLHLELESMRREGLLTWKRERRRGGRVWALRGGC